MAEDTAEDAPINEEPTEGSQPAVSWRLIISPADAKEFWQYVSSALASERAQYERLETRATSIVTTTGGLVTVIGIVTAFIPEGRRSQAFSTVSIVLLVVTLGLFFAAVALALSSNFVDLRIRPRLPPEETAQLVRDASFFTMTNDDLQLLQGYRVASERRTVLLNWATLCQMLAILTLTVAVGIALASL